MGLEEARRHVVALVNRDRAAAGLSPVRLDDVATRAGQRHTDDMASRGFTAHLGSDGSVPEQRYTEAGGRQMVMENVGCFADGEARPLDREPRFTAEGLERIGHLHRELASRNEHDRAGVLGQRCEGGDAHEQRKPERQRLARAGAAATEEVVTGESVGDRRDLDREGCGDVSTYECLAQSLRQSE